MDLVECPDIVNYCLDKLFDLAYINTQRIYEVAPGKIDLSYVAEDMGGQESLMFSPDHIRNLCIFGAAGRYILAPCHNIQAVSPPENIVALYQTGYHAGSI